MYAGKGFTIEDAQWLLPFIDVVARDNDLTDTDSAQTIVADRAIPSSLLVMGVLGITDIQQAYALDGTDATGLTATLGRNGDPDFALLALNLIGVAAGQSLLGGAGVGDAIIGATRAATQVAGGYTPEMLFTATGGATPEVQEANAGLIIGRTHFLCCPSNFADYNVTS